jgi:hypothetical protein
MVESYMSMGGPALVSTPALDAGWKRLVLALALLPRAAYAQFDVPGAVSVSPTDQIFDAIGLGALFGSSSGKDVVTLYVTDYVSGCVRLLTVSFPLPLAASFHRSSSRLWTLTSWRLFPLQVVLLGLDRRGDHICRRGWVLYVEGNQALEERQGRKSVEVSRP